MSATYNLKDQNEYKEYFDSVIEDIDETNPRDGQGYPLDEHDDRITVDWLWENYVRCFFRPHCTQNNL